MPGEIGTTPRVFFWRQPFRANAEPDHLPALRGEARGIVFIHGFACNRGLWTHWMRDLRRLDVPFIAINLEPIFGSIDCYPPIVESAVRRIEAQTGHAPVLVGHSMGGLAIRAWLRDFDSDARVHRVITIGSPHHGTWLARFGRTRNGYEMCLGSNWLAQLVAREPLSRYARFTCFYSRCDNIAFPVLTATLPGADNCHIPGVAHVHLAFQRVVFDEIKRWLLLPPSAVNL